MHMFFLKNAPSEKLKDFADRFTAAESQIKIVECLDKELVIPSVNQLRYAGYHVARAFTALDSNTVDEHLVKAINHCKRSYYDAKEVAVIYLLEKIEAFQNDFRACTEVLKVIPDYCDLIAKAQDASDHIESVKNNHYDKRDEYYTSCDPHYDALKPIANKLGVSRPLILKEIEKERKATRRFIITTLIAVLSLAIVGLKACKDIPRSSCPSSNANFPPPSTNK